MNQVPVLNFRDFIAADGELLTTTSQHVAAVFGKRHDNVLRTIRALMEQLPAEFNVLNFEAVAYLDEKAESRSMYRLTRDGFTLLAMRFTGKKALMFQLAYIEAFNRMAEYIQNQRNGLQYRFLAAELEFKQEKQKVSACAREMRKWQDTKPAMLNEMNVLLERMQPSLLPN